MKDNPNNSRRYSVLMLFFLCTLMYSSCAEPKATSASSIKDTTKDEPIMEKVKVDIPDYIDLNYVLGKFDPKEHSMFSKVAGKYADTENRYMHTEAYQSFIKMFETAKSEGINLQIKSAARNFHYQKSIWDRKWNGSTLLENKINAKKDIATDLDRVKAIMKYSSMPGTSRHHWGTDIDLNNFNNSYFKSGKGKKEYEWLSEHANSFGYYQTYTDKSDGRTGYEEEKWHWSFMPIADLCKKRIEKSFNNELILGFDGCHQAPVIDVKENYILGIDQKCLEYGLD